DATVKATETFALLLLVLAALPVGVETEVGHCLLVKLPAGLDLLALLELLDGVLGLPSPPAIRATDLEAVLVQRLLDLADFAARQVRRLRLILGGLLLLRLLGLLVLVCLLLLCLRLLSGLWLLIA